MGDYLSYPTLTLPTAADITLACAPGNAKVLQARRDSFMPKLISGSTTLTGVGAITLGTGGTLTGSSGDTAGLGSATIEFAGGGGGAQPGPIIGTTTAFTRPDVSALSILAGAVQTATLSQTTGGPITINYATNDAPGWTLVETAALPDAPWMVFCMIEPQSSVQQANGVFISDGSGKFISFASQPSAAALDVQGWNDSTTYAAQYVSEADYNFGARWFKISCDGANLSFYRSSNGQQFDQFGSAVALSSTVMSTPASFGVARYNGGLAFTQSSAIFLWHQPPLT